MAKNMQEGDGEKVMVENDGVAMGHERREVHATGGKMKRRKEVKVVVMNGKSVTEMMTGRKEAEKKEQQRKRQGESQRPDRCKTEELF